ncbi:BspA family leucine-rich repeat surface protein [Enterococcus faecium]
MKVRKIRKIQTIFSVVILLTNPFLGLNVISYAETDDVLEAQTDEQTQTTENEAEVPTEPKEVETPPSSERSETTDTSVTEETLEETSNEGSELAQETTQETKQKPTKDSTSMPSEQTSEPEKEEKVYEKSIVEGTWGSSPWKFDEATGTLRIGSGTLDTSLNRPWAFTGGDQISNNAIKKVVLDGNVVAPSFSRSLFRSLYNLTSIDGLTNLDTSKVTDMNGMFLGDAELTKLDLSSFDTSKVTDMNGMFQFNGTKIASLSLGDKFRFQSDAALGSPESSSELATGKWIREDGKSNAYTPADFMKNYGTGDLTAGTYVAELDSLSATAISQTIPLGTSVESLDVKGFVKEVKLGNTSLTNEQYSVKLIDALTTDIVGKQTVKVEISLNSDSAVKTTVEVPVEIEWGNSIVFKDDFNNNGFSFTAASISLLKGPNGPQLVATRGDGFRNAGSVLFYARPDITIYSKSLDTVVTRIRETTSSQHPNDVRNRWNGLFKELGDQLNYGDILGIKVNQSYGSNANQNGKNTWVSRENELVTETEGFDTAYYELTEDGLKLLELSAHPNKQSVDYGTDIEKIDYTDYVKDVKIGEVVVPKEQYTAKLVGEFDTNKPGEQTIKVEVALKDDGTHKTQVDVPVEIEGTLTIEVPDTLEFQDVKLSKKEQIGQRKTEKPTGFKVTDSRGIGKQGGWYVTAQAITAEEIGIDDYLIYKQINGVSENLTDTVKIHQQEEQGNTEGPLTVDLTSWWTDSSGILLKIPKENTLRPNKDYQGTLVFNIIEAP